jgi:drug/metabolite transporter (DMT)-like permease
MALSWSLLKERGGSTTSCRLIDAAPLGVLCMFVSVSLFPLSDACLKYLLNSYSVEQTAFLRALARFSTLFFASFFYRAPWKFFSTKEPLLHGKRMIVSVLSTYCFMAACQKGSLTLIYTLGYTTPFFMVVLSSLYLKEKVSFDRWIILAIGMIGVLVALRPSFLQKGESLEAAALILLGTFFAAMNKLFIRKLAATEESLTIALYPNLAMMLLCTPFISTSWQSMPMIDWALFGAIGLAMGASQLLVAYSLRCAQASLLAPLDYSTFIWVLLIDMFLWEKMPDAWTVLGACIIILSNVVIFARSKTWTKKSIPL